MKNLCLEDRIQFNVSLCSNAGRKKIDLQKTAADLLNLQRGLTGNRNLAGNGYMQKSSSLEAYLLYYWPVSYLQTLNAVKKCAPLAEKIKAHSDRPVKILDIGSGPAPASSALADYVESVSGKKISFDFTLTDSSDKSLELGRKILDRTFKGRSQIKTQVCDFEKEIPQSAENDFIIASHSLNELWKNDKNRAQKILGFVNGISESLCEDGFLILIEPALLTTSRALIEVRDKMLEGGFSLVSPCLKSYGLCSALQNPKATCHADFNWELPKIVAELACRANLNREEIKMTYFIFGRKNESFEQEDAVPSESNPQEAFEALVVSEPMLNKAGRIRFVLCDGEKRFTLSAKKDDALAGAAGFFALKRFDKIKVEGALARSQKGEPLSLGWTAQTQLTIL